jgi:hypothetical protein
MKVRRLVSDENFDGDILRGLYRRNPSIDIVRIQDCGLSGAPDEDVLAWAATEGRIVLTHDRTTLPSYAYDRVQSSLRMPGVFAVSDSMSVGQAVDEILLAIECLALDECIDSVKFSFRCESSAMTGVDRAKSLQDLEEQDWGEPAFGSHLVRTCHTLRQKPLDQFTVEDLRIMIAHGISLPILLPIAIERLEANPLIAGDFYEGDLLNAVARIEKSFWTARPNLLE